MLGPAYLQSQILGDLVMLRFRTYFLGKRLSSIHWKLFFSLSVFKIFIFT